MNDASLTVRIIDDFIRIEDPIRASEQWTVHELGPIDDESVDPRGWEPLDSITIDD